MLVVADKLFFYIQQEQKLAAYPCVLAHDKINGAQYLLYPLAYIAHIAYRRGNNIKSTCHNYACAFFLCF